MEQGSPRLRLASRVLSRTVNRELGPRQGEQGKREKILPGQGVEPPRSRSPGETPQAPGSHSCSTETNRAQQHEGSVRPTPQVLVFRPPITTNLTPPHLPLLCGFRLHTSPAHPPGLCSVSRRQFRHARPDGRDSRWGLNTQPLTCSRQCGRPMPLRSARGEPEAGRLQPVPCPCPGHATGWQYSQVRVFLASLTDRNLHCSACVRSHVQPARRAVDGPMLTHLPCRL